MLTIAEEKLFEEFGEKVNTVRLNGRIYYEVDGRFYIPKTIWLGVVKVYPNDLKNEDAFFYICDANKDVQPKVISVKDVLDIISKGRKMVNGVTFVYVDKIKKQEGKVKLSVKIPEVVYRKIKELIERSGFKDEEEVIKVAVEHLYRRRQRLGIL